MWAHPAGKCILPRLKPADQAAGLRIVHVAELTEHASLVPHSSTNCRLCFCWGSSYQRSVCSVAGTQLLRRVVLPRADASGLDNRCTAVDFWLSGPCGCGVAAHAAGPCQQRGRPLAWWSWEAWTNGCRACLTAGANSLWAQPVTVASVPDGHRWHGHVLHIPPSSRTLYTLLKPCQPAGMEVGTLPRLGHSGCLAWGGPAHACHWPAS